MENKKVSSDLILGGGTKQRIFDEVCDVKKPFGNWITRYDIVVDEERHLRLSDQGPRHCTAHSLHPWILCTGVAGRCRSECNTIAEACGMVRAAFATDSTLALCAFAK